MQHQGVCLWLQLYTQDFYRDVVKPKLNPDGIFVTQSGPAGVLSSTEVFTAIHKTLQSAFPAVVPYAQHIPSYNDAWVSTSRVTVEHVMHLLDTSYVEPVASTPLGTQAGDDCLCRYVRPQVLRHCLAYFSLHTVTQICKVC